MNSLTQEILNAAIANESLAKILNEEAKKPLNFNDVSESQCLKVDGSLAGKVCKRWLWFNTRANTPITHIHRLNAAVTNKLELIRVRGILKSAGYELFSDDKSYSSVSYYDKDCHTQRIHDIVISPTKQIYVLLVKVHVKGAFEVLKFNGVKSLFPHYAQAQLCALFVNDLYGKSIISNILYAGVSREMGAIHFEALTFNRTYACDLIQENKNIIKNPEPPSMQPEVHNHVMCVRCQHRDKCYDR